MAADKPFSYTPSQQLRKDLSFGRFDWRLAEDAYKQGKYLEALCSTISYIDKQTGEQFTKDPQTAVTISHGSVQMNMVINSGQLQVIAPFVDIATAQKMIILRKICEINFGSLTLARIEVKEDTACFLFSCPLEACEPWKIYNVLKEICWTADKYDDDFVAMHGASWVTPPNITPFTDVRKQQSWQGFKQYLADAREWIVYWKQSGFPYIVWDVLYITFMKIEQLCAPEGLLKNSLSLNIEKLFEKRELNDVNNAGIAYLNTLDAITQETFYSQLYDVSVFIPVKITASAANVQTSLKKSLDDGYNYLNKKDMITAYLCLQKAAYILFYNYRFNETQWQHLQSVMSGDNNLSVADAANKLYTALNEFYTNPRDLFVAPAPDKTAEKKGLFAGWFN